MVAGIGGALTGLVASGFAALLEDAARLRHHLTGWAGHHAVVGTAVLLLVPVITTCIAALLVHHVEPHAEGSGIPRVEAVVEGRAEPGRLRIVPVKFAGGVLAIGGGLALGREGPSVQMGGVIASMCGRLARLSSDEVRIVIAGGAAAGLATAFNAPVAGGVFVLEELLKRFDPRSTLATLAASGAGFAVTHLVRGDTTVFRLPAVPEPRLTQAPLVLVIGIVCGLLGVAYNHAVMAALRLVDTTAVPLLARAAAIGLVTGALLCIRPEWAGSGDNLTQRALSGSGAIGAVLLLLIVRFAFGVLSYSANAPGGLFAPMLVMGSGTGLLVGLVAAQVVHLPAGATAACALVGMASFFTASVQAPVTGLVLATEMTGNVSWLAPMLGAVAIAMLIPALLGATPIYDALAGRSARNARINEVEADADGA